MNNVVVKLGARGALCATSDDEIFLVPALPVVAVDTVAAGLYEGLSLRKAVTLCHSTITLQSLLAHPR